MEKYSTLVLALLIIVGVCSASKPGTCPSVDGITTESSPADAANSCGDDDDNCSGELKCCAGTCVQPEVESDDSSEPEVDAAPGNNAANPESEDDGHVDGDLVGPRRKGRNRDRHGSDWAEKKRQQKMKKMQKKAERQERRKNKMAAKDGETDEAKNARREEKLKAKEEKKKLKALKKQERIAKKAARKANKLAKWKSMTKEEKAAAKEAKRVAKAEKRQQRKAKRQEKKEGRQNRRENQLEKAASA